MRRDTHLEKMRFLTQRINEINEWRNEAVKHTQTQQHKDAIDARVFELRKAVERNMRS